MTPARWAANWSNARKSTGPRTARGKAQSRLNALRTGERSVLFNKFFRAMSNTPIFATDETARAVLTPDQAVHPLFAQAVELFRDVDFGMMAPSEENREGRSNNIFLYDLSRNIFENKGRVKGTSHDVYENKRS
jgi:hypothetical protein